MQTGVEDSPKKTDRRSQRVLAAFGNLNKLNKVVAFDCIERALNAFGIRIRTSKAERRRFQSRWFANFAHYGILYYNTQKKSPFVPDDEDEIDEGGSLCVYVPLNYVYPMMCLLDGGDCNYWAEVLAAHKTVSQKQEGGVNMRTYCSNLITSKEPTLQGPELQKVVTNMVRLLTDAFDEYIKLNKWADRAGVSDIMKNDDGSFNQIVVGWQTRDAFADDSGFYNILQPGNFECIRETLGFNWYVFFICVFHMCSSYVFFICVLHMCFSYCVLDIF